MSNVLALDLSSHTGFAIGGENDPAPLTGVWHLPSISHQDTHGQAFAKLWLHLDEIHLAKPVSVLIFESTLSTYAHTFGSAQKDAELARGLIGLGCVAETWGVVRNCEVFEADVQTVRKHFTGMGRPPHPKIAVMKRCRLLGWEVKDDNAADAAAVWSYEMSHRFPAWAPNATPLFAPNRGKP